MVIYDELTRFQDWLQAKGDERNVVSTLRFITEFEAYTDAAEQNFMEYKTWLKSGTIPGLRS